MDCCDDHCFCAGIRAADCLEQPEGHGLGTITLEGYVGASGLDLKVPSNAGSRLDLTPFQTPASVEVVEGETIRERGQRDVNQAIVQNATGFSFSGSPGNGRTSFSVRGFNGHGSITRLLDAQGFTRVLELSPFPSVAGVSIVSKC